MRILFLLLLFGSTCFSQVRMISWNVQNLGNSKSDSIVRFIAQTVKDCDLVALQEVVAGPGGAQTVARLVQKLNQTGVKWDYVVSSPTSGKAGAERYSYLWKPSVVQKLGVAFLDAEYESEITREPYIGTFQYNQKQFTLVSFHAVPKKKQPETEIKYLKFLPAKYSDKRLIFLGDFNCPQSHNVFNPLRKMGFRPVLQNQKTTLKMRCTGDNCLASEYDNIWIPNSINIQNSGIIEFYNEFSSVKSARKISDHVPVFVTFMP